MDLSPELVQLIEMQAGLVRRDQLAAHGVTRSEVRWALGRRWRGALPGVLATFTGELTAEQQVIAGWLWAGDDAVLTSCAAARWHGLTGVPARHRLVFLVRDPVRRRSAAGVVTSRTRRPDAATRWWGPVPVASAARSVADMARELRHGPSVVALVTEAVQRGVVTAEQMRHELEAGPVRWSARLRRAVEDVTAGAWSLPEADLLDLAARSAILPPLLANPRLRAPDGTLLPTPDALVEQVALAVQVHSVRWHALSKEWEGTVTRDGVFAEHGIPVIAFTPQSIRERPDWVLQRLERSYLALRDRPRPDVSVLPWGHPAHVQ